MLIIKWIPGLLTSARISLTFIYLLLLNILNSNNANKSYFSNAIIVFALICITDFTDGKVARMFNIASKSGELFDIAADFSFIVSSLIAFNVYNIIPIWFTVLVLVKFAEFILTSCFIKTSAKSTNAFFVFDHFGRIAAVLFFLIPGIFLLTYAGFRLTFLYMVLYITLILAIISSITRCIKCYQYFCIIQRRKY